MKKEIVKNVITIGGSAGGISAVSRLISTFGEELDAAVFIVIHVARNSVTEVILNMLQKHTSLKCVIPKDRQAIKNGTIYLARADHHLLLEKGIVRVTKGAYENHWRPAIDVLLRSAAAAYSNCATGIILTGLLDDGTSGMYAIKRSGGTCMVQDPAEAEYPDMPNSVLQVMEVDYTVPINEMGYILADLYARATCIEKGAPADVKLEAAIASRMSSNTEDLASLGEFTSLTCPDCGGVMVKVTEDAIPRYRCYTGHTFTEKALENEQIKGIEESLWVAIRMMEERRNLLVSLMKDSGTATAQGHISKQKRAASIELHIARLKKVLTGLSENT